MAVSNGQNLQQYLNRFLKYYPLVLILLVTLVFISLLGSYGITFDEPENFGIGHKHLYFYQTGHLNYRDDLPVIHKHFNVYNVFVMLYPYHQWPLPNLVSALSCTIFTSLLGWLLPLESHHLSNLFFVLILVISLYLFAKRYLNQSASIITTLVLLTTPRLFADFFNNTKDIPLLCLFSLSLFLFYDWVNTGKNRTLSTFLLVVFLTAATKPDVVYILPIIGIFALTQFKKIRAYIDIRFFITVGVSLIIYSCVFILLFPNLLPVGSSSLFSYLAHLRLQLNLILSYVRWIGTSTTVGFNLYVIKYLFVTTPVITLFVWISGVIYSIKKKDSLSQFLLIWVLVIIVRHSLPGANHYNGVRHFFVIYIPLTILLSQLISTLQKKHLKLGSLLAGLIITAQVFAVTVSHPFQNTYFNSIIGGLAGAQSINFPESYDYWLSSYRQAVSWLCQNTTGQASFTSVINPDLLTAYSMRSGLSLSTPQSEPDYIISNTASTSGTLIHQRLSQGGVVFYIYQSNRLR